MKGSGTSLLRAPLRTEAEMREFVQMSGLESDIEPGLVIATEGERGVMCADEIGLLAARLVIDGEWTDPLPRAAFAARFRD